MGHEHVVTRESQFTHNKLRVQNSFQNLSSADGFRLVICCNAKYRTVTFLNVYAKRGKLALLDQPKEEYKRQLKVYLEDLKGKKLVQHDIANALSEMKE